VDTTYDRPIGRYRSEPIELQAMNDDELPLGRDVLRVVAALVSMYIIFPYYVLSLSDINYYVLT